MKADDPEHIFMYCAVLRELQAGAHNITPGTTDNEMMRPKMLDAVLARTMHIKCIQPLLDDLWTEWTRTQSNEPSPFWGGAEYVGKELHEAARKGACISS